MSYHHTQKTKERISQALQGRHLSDVTKKKISDAKKGTIPWNKGKPFSKETREKFRQKALGRKCSLSTRQKLSEAVKGEKSVCWRKFGNLHPAWKHGLTSLYQRIRDIAEYKNWRYQVFERDHFVCQKCGNKKNRMLQAHHIKPLMKIIKSQLITTIYEAIACNEIWDINNGITYCKSCHIEERGS